MDSQESCWKANKIPIHSCKNMQKNSTSCNSMRNRMCILIYSICLTWTSENNCIISSSLANPVTLASSIHYVHHLCTEVALLQFHNKQQKKKHLYIYIYKIYTHNSYHPPPLGKKRKQTKHKQKKTSAAWGFPIEQLQGKLIQSINVNAWSQDFFLFLPGSANWSRTSDQSSIPEIK